jgi:hypothetical protein
VQRGRRRSTAALRDAGQRHRGKRQSHCST